ncbi:MAG TPA: DNA gyrase subunit A [Candidatus Saccharimonadales bacterium]|nr:DNA gyrase subunit A [Candidatus Saccharimonadales bacterium]
MEDDKVIPQPENTEPEETLDAIVEEVESGDDQTEPSVAAEPTTTRGYHTAGSDEVTEEKTINGLIRSRSITNEMTESYLDYAMSVIVMRALPDVRDGLKPVHRRILFAMSEMGLTPSAKHRKSAKITGEVLGSFHPHGELAVYDSMVRMAQWWSLRLPLVNGQGNFGSMDGDSAAAPRYTEARLAPPSDALLADIEKETVDFRENYDGTRQEPVVLPTRLPNLLINGSQGIAVGMATNIPTHNPGEIIDGLLLLQKNPEATIDELIEIITGPDFPTGGVAYSQVDIKEALSTGRGRVIVRGVASIEEDKKREIILVTALPYQVNKSNWIRHIAELVKVKKIEGISDIRDESDRKEAVRVVIELKVGAPSSKILNQLYDLTELQTVIHYNMVALIDGIQPKLLNLTEILVEFLAHRTTVVTRRTEYELKIAQARAHILEGLKIALDHLDAIIKLIRESANRDAAKTALMEKYKLSEIQANAILDMRLSQLANLERQRIYDEYDAVMKLIADLEDILAKPARIQKIITDELLEIKKKYDDPRRTEIRPEALGQLTALDLIAEEDVLISITANNYIKRLLPDTYKSQSRGGKGVIGTSVREDDQVMEMIFASTHDDILLFTNKGRAFKIKAFEIPVSSRQSKGIALPNVVRINPDEKVTAMVNIGKAADFKYFFFATKKGVVKRVAKDLFENVRKSGVTAVGLRPNDQLIWVRQTSGDDEIAQITRGGQVIMYNENDVRPMGRSAAGVRGINLKGNDEVIETAVLAESAQAVCVLSEKGIGKKVDIKEFRNQHRGGSGIRIAKLTDKTGKLTAGEVLDAAAHDLVIATTSGQVIRISVGSVKKLSRQASGVILIRMNGDDRVSTMAVVAEADEEQAAK